MNYLLNRLNYPFNDLTMPEGLEQLLNDISREVLRAQPTTDGIYDFIASYLEKILATRETVEGIETLLNRIINRAADIAQDLQNHELELQKADQAVEVVRCYFENFVEEKRKEKYGQCAFKFEEKDLISELINKCKLSETEVLRIKPVIFKAYQNFITDYLEALEGAILPPEMLDSIMQFTIDRYITKRPSCAVQTKAATTIQAAYKGYKVRKQYKNCKIPDE